MLNRVRSKTCCPAVCSWEAPICQCYKMAVITKKLNDVMSMAGARVCNVVPYAVPTQMRCIFPMHSML